MKPVKVFMLILIFSVLLTACGSVPAPPVDDPSALATMVAATVQAALNESPAEAPADNNTPALPAAPTPASPAENGNAPAPAAPTATLLPTPTVPPPPPPAAGLKVAYLKDGNIYVWTEGGSSTGITGTHDAISVDISDDGQLVAYVRELAGAPFAYELWVVNSDGAPLNPRLLVSHTEMTALKNASQFSGADGFDFDQIEFRPGTHDIYYSTVPRFMGPGYAPSYDLRVVNVDTEAKSVLFDFGQAGAFTFSPDGTQIALSLPEHISLVNADGSNLRSHVLTYPPVITYSEYQYTPSPIWDSSSASLRVAIPPADPLAEPKQPTTLWFIPVEGSPSHQIGSMDSISFDWADNSFSPDMSYIAYVKSVGEPTENQRELHIAYADGSGDIVFATGTSLQFRGWTPDSTRFLYASNSVDDTGLYLGSIDGGVFTISSVHQTMRQIAWVDNDRIIFVYENPTTNASELRISHQGGTNHAFIDTLTDSFSSYDFTQ